MLNNESSFAKFRFDTAVTHLRVALEYFDTAENVLSEVGLRCFLEILTSCLLVKNEVSVILQKRKEEKEKENEKGKKRGKRS